MQPVFSLNISMPKPSVLLYNMASDARTAAIEAYLSGSGVTVIHVKATDFNRPIASLFSLPGFKQDGKPVYRPPFSEEMLVMAGFSQKRLSDFLRFFREKQLRRVALKAMLTPSNATWSGAELLWHLKQEQAQFDKAVRR